MIQITRRQTFKLLMGAAALLVQPMLIGGEAAQLAVPDPVGDMLAKDGSFIKIADFPELSRRLAWNKKWLEERIGVKMSASSKDLLDKYHANDRVYLAETERLKQRYYRNEYEGSISKDGLSIRLMNMAPTTRLEQDRTGKRVRVDHSYFVRTRTEGYRLAGDDIVVRTKTYV